MATPETGSMHLEDMLGYVIILLAAAVVVVPVLERFRVSPVLGYLVAGFLVGPGVAGLISDTETIRHVAEIGVVLMLFVLGLELSLERLRAMKREIFGLGAAQLGVTSLVIAAAALSLGFDAPAATAIGLGLGISSTAVVLKILAERGELLARHGRTSFSILLFQDIAVAPILVLLPLLAGSAGDGPMWQTIGLALVKGVAVVAAILIVARLALRPVLGRIAKSRNREVFAALVLMIALGTALVTQIGGLSMALGAFLAGVLLSDTDYRHQIEADIEPFRGLFLGLFFMAVGMLIDPAMVVANIPLLLGLLGALLISKGAIIIALARLFGLSLAVSTRTGLMMAQAGEFGFVIFSLAILEGLIDADTGQILIAVIALSMAVTPLLALLQRKAGLMLEGRAHTKAGHDIREATARAKTGDTASNDPMSEHIIIAGFGRVGQTVARLMDAQKLPWLALDLDSTRVERARKERSNVWYGNAGQPDVMRLAGADNARAVVITLDQPHLAEALVHGLRQNFPALFIVARAHDAEHAIRLKQAGASEVIPETLEASLQLAAATLRHTGASAEVVQGLVDRLRQDNFGRFGEVIPAGEKRVPPGAV